MVKHEGRIKRRPWHSKHVAIGATDVVVHPAVNSLNALVLNRVVRGHVAEDGVVVIVGEEIIKSLTHLRAEVVHVVDDAVILDLGVGCFGCRIPHSLGVD